MITTNITLKASVCLFVLSVTAAAQYYGDQPDNSRLRTISTAGAAEVRVVPSRVVITFGVETTNPGLAAAKQENDTKSAAIISMAKASGVQPKDVQTDYVFVEPVYNGYEDDRRRKFMHCVVRKTVVVLLRDVSKFEQVLGGGLDQGATHVLGVQFEVDDLKKHRDKVRSEAIRAAREKAQALTAELGAKIGRVLNIQDYGSNDPSYNYGRSWEGGYYRSGGGTAQISSEADSPILPTVGNSLALGQMRIKATISVTFELL